METYQNLSRDELIERLEAAESSLSQISKEKNSLVKEKSEASKTSNELLDVIIPLGTALSAEKDLNKLFKKILDGARDICLADGGSIYIKNGSVLEFKVIQNETLKIEWHDELIEEKGFRIYLFMMIKLVK